jgi:hypothetical protein
MDVSGRAAVAALALALLGCGLPACTAGDHAGLALLREDAEVEFQTIGGGDEWRSGLVGTLRGKCLAVLEPSPPPPRPARRFTYVPFDEISALRVARNAGADGVGGTASDSGVRSGPAVEAWFDLPMDAVRRRFGRCDALS